ncbi:MAG: division/cell wall cluster transcriptional repressor MraZ [Chloroflexota bacterium]
MGEFDHSVDDKGRLAIPAKFRERFADGVVVTRGLDHCLFVYTANDWATLADKIAGLPLTQADARAFSRLMFSGATDAQLDKQGRVIVPSYLRDYARIQSDVVIIGVNTRLEIWDRDSWAQTRAKVEEEGEFIAEQLATLGI